MRPGVSDEPCLAPIVGHLRLSAAVSGSGLARLAVPDFVHFFPQLVPGGDEMDEMRRVRMEVMG